jgi:hypothetical protein
MMTRATDARSKVVFKIVQAKNSVFTNGLLANGLDLSQRSFFRTPGSWKLELESRQGFLRTRERIP